MGGYQKTAEGCRKQTKSLHIKDSSLDDRVIHVLKDIRCSCPALQFGTVAAGSGEHKKQQY